jgi:hypothetical protein
MSFEQDDKIRDLENQLRDLRSLLGRLPTRPAIFEGGSGGGATAGWGKVVAHGDQDRIMAFDQLADPPTLGWGYINPCSAPNLPTDPDEPPEPGDLETSTDTETFLPVYNNAPEEIEPGGDVDIYVFWVAVPSGHRHIVCQFCVEAEVQWHSARSGALGLAIRAVSL